MRTRLVFASAILLVHIVEGQRQYEFSFDRPGVAVRSGSMMFHRSATLDLMELYSPNRASETDDSGDSYIDGIRLSDDGYVEIRVYDLDEDTWSRGNLIYGASSNVSGKNYSPDSWQILTEFKHWDKFGSGDHFPVPSTNIKFLSQFEQTGLVCHISKTKVFFHVLDAAFTVHHLITFLAKQGEITNNSIIAQILIAGQMISILYTVSESLLMDRPNELLEQGEPSAVWLDLKKWIQNNILMYDKVHCEFPLPLPIVIVEVKVHNYVFNEAKIPGLALITGRQLFEKGKTKPLLKPEGFREVDFADLSAELVSILPNDYRVNQDGVSMRYVPGYPVPHVLLLPDLNTESEVKNTRLTLPKTGRLTIIGEHERMKSLAERLESLHADELRVEVLAFNAMAVEAEAAGTELHYDLYSLVGMPGYSFETDVTARGPFLMHFGFSDTPEFPGLEPEEVVTLKKSAPSRDTEPMDGERDNRDYLVIYPNPTNGPIQIQFHLNEGTTFRMTLTDVFGKMVYREDVALPAGVHSKMIETSASTGVHLLRIETGNRERIVKIIID